MAEDTKIKLSENSEYSINKDSWVDQKNILEGKHDVMTSEQYLFKHEIEADTSVKGSAELYKIRKQISRYSKLPKRIYNRYLATLFSEPLQVDDATKNLLGDAINNIDGEGNSLETFIKNEIFYNVFTFGKAYIRTDSPASSASTEAERIKLGINPYFNSIQPLKAKDWAMNKIGSGQRGVFKFFREELVQEADRESSETAPSYKTISNQYLLIDGKYSLKQHELDNGSWKLVETKPINDLDYLPIQVLNYESIGGLIFDPVLQYHNTLSDLVNALHYHGYPLKIITLAVGTPPMSDKRFAMSEGTTALIPGGSSVTQLGTDSLAALRDFVSKAEANVYKAGFMQPRIMADTSDSAQSVEAQRELKQEYIQYSQGLLNAMETLINQSLKDFAAFKSEPSFDGKVTFNKDLKDRDIQLGLETEALYKDEIKKYPTWLKSILKKVAKSQQLEDVADIVKEIDTKTIELNNAGDSVNPVAKNLNNIILNGE